MPPEIEARIKAFRTDLANLTPEEMFVRHVRDQQCYAITDEEHAQIRNLIAQKFNTSLENIVVVGSAKLGFTLLDKSTDYRHRPRYSPFSDLSDVDVAIVDDRLFDEYWKFAYDFTRGGAYWPDKEKFGRYLVRGWINPLSLPAVPGYSPSQDWKAFFRSLLRTEKCGEYPINGAVYRTQHFFTTYHCDTIQNLKQE